MLRIIFCVLVFISLHDSLLGNICVSKTNCRECITVDSDCAWCKMPTIGNSTLDQISKCDHIDSIRVNCVREHIVYPENKFRIDRDQEFQPLIQNSPAVQVRPQVMSVTLRPNKPIRFNISYQLAEDYPVDLYFLMDLSHSMSTHKDKLSKLGQTLALNMRNITKNFRLGFGSFVEKEIMPFVNTAPRKFSNPCTGGGSSQCVSPYSFIHHLTLTDNATDFESQVTAAKVSGNIDSPEGGLDALMQVVVCGGKIGWRDTSRKLVVYSTDAGFHYAGDGKLAGIIEPNDGECHLVNSRYSHSLLQDYPSIGEINKKITQNNVNVIFAITEDQMLLYKNLSELIDSSFVGVLTNDSSNIVELVVNVYKTIAKQILFQTEQLPEGVQVKFFSKCDGNKLLETSSCDGVKIKEKVQFEVEITMTKCPTDVNKFKRRTVNIVAAGINERIVVNLDPICSCDCEKDDQSSARVSSYCNNRGKIICGICECDEISYGQKCECSKADSSDSKGNTSTCIDPKQVGGNKLICNNQGRCSCGQCICNDPSRISGKYCECDNESCDRYLGLVCAGNGRCDCGICKCNPGWTGSDCKCSTDNSTCEASNGLICNGKGRCECGKCICDESGYFGRTCEDCPNCPGPCENNKDCVQCKVFGSGKKKSKQDCDKCDIEYQVVDRLESDSDDKNCQFIDSSDNCTYIFFYSRLNDKIIKVQKQKECPKVFPIWGIVTIIVSGVLAVGFAMLISWKVLDTMQQKRECARFNEERKKATWETNENPLFKPATTKFTNPAYQNLNKRNI